jgi:hypothetical protein
MWKPRRQHQSDNPASIPAHAAANRDWHIWHDPAPGRRAAGFRFWRRPNGETGRVELLPDAGLVSKGTNLSPEDWCLNVTEA